MTPPTVSPVAAFIQRFLPGIRFPWLFGMLAALLAIDLVVADPVPLVDEIVLAILTFLVASWRTRSDDAEPPPIKDVTPTDETSETLPRDRTADE